LTTIQPLSHGRSGGLPSRDICGVSRGGSGAVADESAQAPMKPVTTTAQTKVMRRMVRVFRGIDALLRRERRIYSASAR
jgi:hypothetical protein